MLRNSLIGFNFSLESGLMVRTLVCLCVVGMSAWFSFVGGRGVCPSFVGFYIYGQMFLASLFFVPVDVDVVFRVSFNFGLFVLGFDFLLVLSFVSIVFPFTSKKG
jgi:hypothetical protein